MGVGGQGHVPVGVAGPTGDGAPVHAPGDQLGDHEMAQVMQPAAHPEAAGEPLESVGDAVGVDRLGPVRGMGEQIGVGGQGGPAGQGVLGLGDPAGAPSSGEGTPI